MREYLEALDEEALAETLPKRLSLTDPQARWTAAPGGPAFFACSANYLIDTEHGVIVDVAGQLAADLVVSCLPVTLNPSAQRLHLTAPHPRRNLPGERQRRQFRRTAQRFA